MTDVPVPFDDAYDVVVEADGTAILTFPRDQQLVNLNVSQVSVEMPTAPTGSTCVMRKNGAFVTHLIASGDAAGGDPPLFVRPGERITIEWRNCTPADRGTALFIYERIGFR